MRDPAASIGDLLGLEIKNQYDLYRAVTLGFPSSAFRELKQNFPQLEIAGISAEKKRLSTDESEYVVRLATALLRATDLFGDRGRAVKWMQAQNIFSDVPHTRPVDLCRSEVGGRLLGSFITSANYGFS